MNTDIRTMTTDELIRFADESLFQAREALAIGDFEAEHAHLGDHLRAIEELHAAPVRSGAWAVKAENPITVDPVKVAKLDSEIPF